jgi:hypothetical protein
MTQQNTEVHNGEKALVACLFSACVNCTRDGKNIEDEFGENGQMKQRKPAGYRFNKISVRVHCRGLGWSTVQQWHSQVLLPPPSYVCEWKEWKKDPQNSQNPHIYLHVPEMTHGAHEVCSSPFGSRSPSPKELRINSYPPHNI